MINSIDIHSLWRVYDDIKKKKGKISIVQDRGIASVFGPDRAMRELKKRCDNELQTTGMPLAGCSLYVSYLYSLVDINTTYESSNDREARGDINARLLMVGEDELVEFIEGKWAKNKDAFELPKGDVLDVFEEFDEIIAEKYGEVCPMDTLTSQQIKTSKDLALSLGKRKRRAKPVEEPVTPVPEATEPGSKPAHEMSIEELKAMLDAKIKAQL